MADLAAGSSDFMCWPLAVLAKSITFQMDFATFQMYFLGTECPAFVCIVINPADLLRLGAAFQNLSSKFPSQNLVIFHRCMFTLEEDTSLWEELEGTV